MDFTGKTAVITGAASGMGLLTARCYSERGGNVVMSDINSEALHTAVTQINAVCKGSAIGVTCDVRDYSQVCRVCDEAISVYGRIDLLVNFAGGAEVRMLNVEEQEFPDIPIEVYDWGIDVNLKGQFYFDHAVLKQMRKQESGVIINIGSITGLEGCDSNVAYSASKSAAMYGLTKSIALYGGKYGIRCCCVSPGPVLTREAMSNMKTLLGRAAQPQEIVDMVLYLASEKADYITGVNFLLDGGRSVLMNKR